MSIAQQGIYRFFLLKLQQDRPIEYEMAVYSIQCSEWREETRRNKTSYYPKFVVSPRPNLETLVNSSKLRRCGGFRELTQGETNTIRTMRPVRNNF